MELVTFTSSMEKFFKNGGIASISKFTRYSSSENEESYSYGISDLEVTFIIIIFIVSMSLGFFAINNICQDTSSRGKNTRLGLYLLMILSGGTVAWFYILLWILKINICA